jgi:alanyl-tRNA synthetase
MRRVASITEDVRAEAQAFVSTGPAIFAAIAETPSAILMAASKNSGINCGEVLKRLLAPSGGRGGGSAIMAQGSLPSSAALQELVENLSRELHFPA